MPNDKLLDFEGLTYYDQKIKTYIKEQNDFVSTDLENQIQQEAETRKQADTVLQQNIDSEKSQRTTADQTLQQNIDNEAASRQSADTALGSRIDNVINGTTPVNKVQNSLSFGTSDSLDTYDGSAPKTITKNVLGLGNVDNTSDINKPVSTAQQQAIDNAVNGLLGDAGTDYNTLGKLEDSIQNEVIRAQEAESDLQISIDEEESRAIQVEGQLGTRITSIEEKIPNQASPINQLADKAFVNSSIQQMAANRVTYDAQGNPFPTRQALLSATTYYHNGEPYTPNDHDYALVTADEGAPTPFTGGQTRFEWTGSEWEYAYGINERPFTSEEWSAIESGITSEKVAEIGTKLPINDTTNSLYGTDSGGSQVMVPRSSFATSAQGQKADTAYQKPEGGIPKTDLDSSVQGSLNKADSAYQKPTGGITESDLSQSVNASLDKADSAYQKPSSGIPKSDLDTAVQSSLSKADTSYQKPSGGIPKSDLDTAVQEVLTTAEGEPALRQAADTALGERIDDILDGTTPIHGWATEVDIKKLFYTFSSSSWEKIKEISESGQAATYFSVGDEKTIDLTTGEQITLVILGFNHDDLSDGSGKAGITIGMKNLLATTYRMNTSNTNAGGWNESGMRTSTMATLLSQLPSDLQSMIKQVNKKATAGSQSTTITTSADKLWLFSEVEIDGTTKEGYAEEGEQYEYWQTVKDGTVDADRIKYLSNGSGNANTWWLRSPYISDSGSFRCISSTGHGNSTAGAQNTFGVSFGFCV